MKWREEYLEISFILIRDFLLVSFNYYSGYLWTTIAFAHMRYLHSFATTSAPAFVL